MNISLDLLNTPISVPQSSFKKYLLTSTKIFN